MKKELIFGLCGVPFVTLAPSLSIYLANYPVFGYQSKAYCGFDKFGWQYEVKQWLVLWLATDFYMFAYHYGSHCIDRMWNRHKFHHKFYNPSPFAVISDDFSDQLIRSAPLLFFPMIAPVNMELMFAQWATLFYLFGVFLHLGHETKNVWLLSAHQPYIITSYHHYLHHLTSIKNKVYHVGFFIQAWDKIFGSEYPGKCQCILCQKERTREEFEQLHKPDYSQLLSVKFWLEAPIGE